MHLPNFEDIAYLQAGSPLQQRAYAILRDFRVMEILQDFNPILIGTIPLDIAIADSDLDIACEVYDLQLFADHVAKHFARFNAYQFNRKWIRGKEVGIVNFILMGIPVELYGEGRPVPEQYGYRHLVVEAKLLASGGEGLKREVIRLKEQGLKTEPAFAQALNLEGDPYENILLLV